MDQKVSGIVVLVLKAVGLVLAVAAIVISNVATLPIETTISFLGGGLLAIAAASLIVAKEPE